MHLGHPVGRNSWSLLPIRGHWYSGQYGIGGPGVPLYSPGVEFILYRSNHSVVRNRCCNRRAVVEHQRGSFETVSLSAGKLSRVHEGEEGTGSNGKFVLGMKSAEVAIRTMQSDSKQWNL